MLESTSYAYCIYICEYVPKRRVCQHHVSLYISQLQIIVQ